MQILINNESVDVTLEQESNIGEVYDSLCSWMRESGMYPISLQLDSKVQDLDSDQNWKVRPVEEVTLLDLKAGTIKDQRKKEFITVIDYILLLKECAENKNSESLTEASAEYDYILPVLPRLVSMDYTDFCNDYSSLNRLIQEANSRALNTKEYQQLADKLNILYLILIDRLQELDKPIIALHKTAELLRGIVPQLEEAAIALQTGNERETYSLVLKISEIMAKILRISEILSLEYSQESLQVLFETIKNMGNIVEEMNTAMQNSDPVILADILEYDLHDILEQLSKESLNVHKEKLPKVS